MIVYRDRVTDVDHISDAYQTEECFDGAIMSCKATWGLYADNEDVQLSGANASAEGEDEDLGSDETKTRKLNTQHMFNLKEIDYMTKAAFKEFIKEGRATMEGYIKKDTQAECEYKKMAPEEVDALAEERIKSWRKGIMAFVSFICKNWKNTMFFYDKEMDVDGAKPMYVGDENGDTMYYIKCLYVEEKC